MLADRELRGAHRDQHLEFAFALFHRAPPFGDVALNPEVAGDAPVSVVEADVVPFDEDRIAVETAFLRFDMKAPAIEELPPHPARVTQVVREQLPRCDADELIRRGPVLPQHRVVGLGHAVVIECVVEERFLVSLVVPRDRLVQHHEEEAVERLGEEELESIVRGSCAISKRADIPAASADSNPQSSWQARHVTRKAVRSRILDHGHAIPLGSPSHWLLDLPSWLRFASTRGGDKVQVQTAEVTTVRLCGARW